MGDQLKNKYLLSNTRCEEADQARANRVLKEELVSDHRVQTKIALGEGGSRQRG